MSATPHTLSNLYKLARELSVPEEEVDDAYRIFGLPRPSEFGETQKYLNGLSTVGLTLLSPPGHFGYWCTPTNSLTFAHTGGDGVHFGLLALAEGFVEDSPIVMTVPMNGDEPNVVVGANLRDFLALGCRSGYDILEQLTYQRSETLPILIATADAEYLSETQVKVLERLRTALGLTPWGDPEATLNALRTKFLPEVRVEREDAI